MNVRLATLTVALVSSLASLPAAALVNRAFVSGGGSDANTAVSCSLSQPCRTFQTAMTVLNDGGEVIALDSAGYGTVNITKSVSLIAPAGIFAGLTPTSGNAVTIATAGVEVVLKGLTINSLGGVNGITMTAGKSLTIDHLTIGGFSNIGISVQTAATVNVIDTVVRDNINGIVIGNGARASIMRTNVLDNPSEGVEVRTSVAATGATTTVDISDSVVSGSAYCVDNFDIPGNTGVINATRVAASNCSARAFLNERGAGTMTVTASTATGSGIGYRISGPGTTMTVSGSSASGNSGAGFSGNSGALVINGCTSTNNAIGIERITATVVSMGNNAVYGNTTNISGAITPVALQ